MSKIAYQHATSGVAWQDFIASGNSERLDARIVRSIAMAPKPEEGLTCQEIEDMLDDQHQSVSGNLRHLVEKNIIEASGFFGMTRRGRKCNKWRLVLR